MFRNYLKTAIRNLWKNKTFSFINVFGLSVGFICCLLIGAYITDELSYDKQAAASKDIYRIELSAGNDAFYSSVDAGVGPGLKDMFPEIDETVRFNRWSNCFIQFGEKQFKEAAAVTDPNFLDMFAVGLEKGDPLHALSEPYSIVISETSAKKYFGNADPIGQFLIVNGETKNPYKVTGVAKDLSTNRHFQFDIYISRNQTRVPTWSNIGTYTYVKLKPGTNVAALEKKFPQAVAKHVVPEIQVDMGVSLAEAQKSISSFIFYLKPLTSIHLYSENKDELQGNGSIKYVYIFSALAIFILLLACVNFTNLSTAVSSKRSKEVGVRKVMGSGKHQLVSQFLTESIVLALLSFIFALLVVWMILPFFNSLAGKNISMSFFLHPYTLLTSLPVVCLIGLIAGLYPSFVIASFNIINSLKGGKATRPQSSKSIRSSLVVFQFCISTILIIATIVVYRQLSFMQNKKLGFDKEQTIVLNDTHFLKDNQAAFKEELLKDSRVTNVTISRDVPIAGKGMDGTQAYRKEKDNQPSPEIHINKYHIDYDYLPTLGMEIASGRNLSREFPTDSFAVLLNETAVADFGFAKNDVIGKHIITSGQHDYTVVGVVKDFHYVSIKEKIAPLALMLGNNNGGMIVRVKTPAIESFLQDTKNKWSSYNAGGPFSYSFVKDQFAAVYASEKKTGQIFTVFACISILIAAMGLFGLSAFIIAQRTKEIGVRKVLGASVRQVVFTLSREFLILVVISFVIAIPIAWLTMNKWLEEFAYRTTIGLPIFLLACAVALIIAIATVSMQAIKAAIANPVKSIRTQ